MKETAAIVIIFIMVSFGALCCLYAMASMIPGADDGSYYDEAE